jgi:hypothetical protein
MTAKALAIATALGAATLAGAARADPVAVFTAPEGDAVVRRTDACNCAPINPAATLPDLVQLRISGWTPASPATDLFTGVPGGCSSGACIPRFLRIDVVFSGLVNPPGTIGVAAGALYNPFQFGPSPLFGFIDFDIDRDANTGGDAPPLAPTRFLANAARFGARPNRLAARAAVTGNDLHQPWNADPQIMRSGADFTLVLCGCFPVSVVSRSNPASITFGPGDTWVVAGRFFQRASGYAQASNSIGGSTLGAYDPVTRLRFQHSLATNRTTVSLVFPIDQTGAQQMLGLSQPPPLNTSVSDAFSVQEAMHEIILRAQQPGTIFGLQRALISRWAGKTIDAYNDPAQWDVTALVGTAYAQPADAPYAWTDAGFDLIRGDVDADLAVGPLDRAAVLGAIQAFDALPGFDAIPVPDGRVRVPAFGPSFNLFDVNADGWIDAQDASSASPASCAADFDLDGAATIDDIFVYLNAWFAYDPRCDLDAGGSVTIDDLFLFLNRWFAGC